MKKVICILTFLLLLISPAVGLCDSDSFNRPIDGSLEKLERGDKVERGDKMKRTNPFGDSEFVHIIYDNFNNRIVFVQPFERDTFVIFDCGNLLEKLTR